MIQDLFSSTIYPEILDVNELIQYSTYRKKIKSYYFSDKTKINAVDAAKFALMIRMSNDSVCELLQQEQNLIDGKNITSPNFYKNYELDKSLISSYLEVDRCMDKLRTELATLIPTIISDILVNSGYSKLYNSLGEIPMCLICTDPLIFSVIQNLIESDKISIIHPIRVIPSNNLKLVGKIIFIPTIERDSYESVLRFGNLIHKEFCFEEAIDENGTYVFCNPQYEYITNIPIMNVINFK